MEKLIYAQIHIVLVDATINTIPFSAMAASTMHLNILAICLLLVATGVHAQPAGVDPAAAATTPADATPVKQVPASGNLLAGRQGVEVLDQVNPADPFATPADPFATPAVAEILAQLQGEALDRKITAALERMRGGEAPAAPANDAAPATPFSMEAALAHLYEEVQALKVMHANRHVLGNNAAPVKLYVEEAVAPAYVDEPVLVGTTLAFPAGRIPRRMMMA